MWYRAQVIIWAMEMPRERRRFGEMGDVMVILPQDASQGGATIYIRDNADWLERRESLLAKGLAAHVAHPGIRERRLVPASGVLAWKSSSASRKIRERYGKDGDIPDNASLLQAMFDDLLAQVRQCASSEDPLVTHRFLEVPSTPGMLEDTRVSPELLERTTTGHSTTAQ